MWPWTKKRMETKKEEVLKFQRIITRDTRRDAAQVGFPTKGSITYILLREEGESLIAASSFIFCRDHIADLVKAILLDDLPGYLTPLLDSETVRMDLENPLIGIVYRGTEDLEFASVSNQIVSSLRMLEAGMGWSGKTKGYIYLTPHYVPSSPCGGKLLTCVLRSPSRWFHAPQLLSIYTLATRLAAYHGIPRSLNKEDVYATGRLLRYYRYLAESQPFAFYEENVGGEIRKMFRFMPDTNEYLPACLDILPTVLAYEETLFDGTMESYYKHMEHGAGGIVSFPEACYNEAVRTARENLMDLLKTETHNSNYRKITEVLNGKRK